MRETVGRWLPSSMLLAASGILLIGVGIYFLFLRPALLPEDIRYMNLTPAELQSIGPRPSSWLTHVFRVMGGYVAATGLLALTLGGHPSATIGWSPRPAPESPAGSRSG